MLVQLAQRNKLFFHSQRNNVYHNLLYVSSGCLITSTFKMDNKKIETFIDTDTKVHLEPIKYGYYEFTKFRVRYNRLNSLLQIS